MVLQHYSGTPLNKDTSSNQYTACCRCPSYHSKNILQWFVSSDYNRSGLCITLLTCALKVARLTSVQRCLSQIDLWPRPTSVSHASVWIYKNKNKNTLVVVSQNIKIINVPTVWMRAGLTWGNASCSRSRQPGLVTRPLILPRGTMIRMFTKYGLACELSRFRWRMDIPI